MNSAYEDMLLWSAKMHRMLARMGGSRPPMAEVQAGKGWVKVNLENVYDANDIRAAIAHAVSQRREPEEVEGTVFYDCDCSGCRNSKEGV